MLGSKEVTRELERLMYNRGGIIAPHIKVYKHEETQKGHHKTIEIKLYPESVSVGYDPKRRILIVQYGMLVSIDVIIIDNNGEKVDRATKTLDTLKKVVCFLDFHSMNHVSQKEREAHVMTERRDPPKNLTQVRGDYILGHLTLAERKNKKNE